MNDKTQASILKFVSDRVENFVEKGGNAGHAVARMSE